MIFQNGTANETLKEEIMRSFPSIITYALLALMVIFLLFIWVRPLIIIKKRKSTKVSNSDTTTSILLNKDVCPFCIEPITNQVELSCGHAFCAKCMCEFWKSRHGPLMKCAVCKRQTECIFKFYKHDRVRPADDIIEGIDEYNKLFSKYQCGCYNVIRDFSIIIRYYIKYCKNTCKSVFLIILGIAVLAYIGSPYDGFSEHTNGAFGYLDDMVLLILSVVIMGKIMMCDILKELTNH